jgi:hypothetical protein
VVVWCGGKKIVLCLRLVVRNLGDASVHISSKKSYLDTTELVVEAGNLEYFFFYYFTVFYFLNFLIFWTWICRGALFDFLNFFIFWTWICRAGHGMIFRDGCVTRH